MKTSSAALVVLAAGAAAQTLPANAPVRLSETSRAAAHQADLAPSYSRTVLRDPLREFGCFPQHLVNKPLIFSRFASPTVLGQDH